MTQNGTPFKETARTNVSIRFQLTFIILGLAGFLALLSWRASFFSPQERLPKLLPITPTAFKEFGGFANSVETGLNISQFIDFNMVTNEFIFDGILWFSFHPGAISIDTLNQFSFVKGEIIKRSDPIIKMVDEKLNVQYTIRVKFKSALNYKEFPLDDHQIYIVMINQAVSPSEVVFESSARKFVITADVSTAGWDLEDKSVQVGFFESQLDPDNVKQTISYPGTMFILDYSRNSIRYALSIVLPLAMIFYVILFSISIRLISAIAISAGGITAILAYRFVIENLSPKTGFFMLSDYLFFLFLAATIAVFVINVAETSFQIEPRYKKGLVLLIHCAVIATVLYFLLRW